LIDLHCHLLPGIDDGAKDLEMSLAMARMASSDGISTIACTHILPGSIQYRSQSGAVAGYGKAFPRPGYRSPLSLAQMCTSPPISASNYAKVRL
jgi:hypothetical protein